MRKITHHITKTNKQTPVVNSAGVKFLLRKWIENKLKNTVKN